MKFYDPEKVRQSPPAKRKKFLVLLSMKILFNMFLVVGYFMLGALLHQPPKPQVTIFILIVSGISFTICISYWFIVWSAFRKIPYSEK
jgi:hypothetical protein